MNATHPGMMRADQLARELIDLDRYAAEVTERRGKVHSQLCKELAANENFLLDGEWVFLNTDGENITYQAVTALPDSRPKAG